MDNLDLPVPTRQLLERYGFDATSLHLFRSRLHETQDVTQPNTIRGEITPPLGEDIRPLPPRDTPARESLAKRGMEAIRAGEVGCVVLAGGMATRFGGVVKATVDVLEGASFLDLKLGDIARCAERCGGRVPIFLMTSFATHEPVQALAAAASTPACPVEAFPQFIALRLDETGGLFRDAEGAVSPYAPGHGDLTFALRRAGVLERFRAGGGKLLYMSNVDNLAATLDPAVLGAHLESGSAVTVEVADKVPGEKGGAPARVEGHLQIVEDFRFPQHFDRSLLPVFNTNSFTLDAAAIDRDFPLSWFLVRKQVEGRTALQFERLVGEVTAFLPTHCLRIEREGLDGRFQPIKDPPDLAERRSAIRSLLQARKAL